MSQEHYTDYLNEEIQQRKSRNARYSERAFAQSIGLSPGFLKLLLQKKKALSLERAKEIVMKIPWETQKKYGFLDLVQRQSSETIEKPAKIFSVLFTTREREYAGTGSLTYLKEQIKVPYTLAMKLSRSHKSEKSMVRIFTRYVYASGLSYDIDLHLVESQEGTFTVLADDKVIGAGFYVGKICHVDINYVHPQMGPLQASISYCFTADHIEATGRNYTSNSTFLQKVSPTKGAKEIEV